MKLNWPLKMLSVFLSALPLAGALLTAAGVIYTLILGEWAVALFLLAITAFLLPLGWWVLRISIRVPRREDIVQVTGSGIVHEWALPKTGDAGKEEIPFSRMTSLYILPHAQRFMAGKTPFYAEYPRLVAEWREDGERRLLSITEKRPEDFWKLYEQFPPGIPVKTGYFNIAHYPDYALGPVLDEHEYREILTGEPLLLPFVPGRITLFGPPTPRLLMPGEERKRYVWIFDLSGVAVLMVCLSIMLIGLVRSMPGWEIENGMFVSDDEYNYVLLFLVPLFFFFHIRKRAYLVRLIIQAAVIVAIWLFAGWIAARSHPVHPDFMESVRFSAILTTVWILLSYAAGKLIAGAGVLYARWEEKRRLNA
ncbi:hypothetical protein [Bhargavaea ullalensis]|uniref:Uncharacterized protein n=1 Tax=Bhargavaea ullalensis TaxID=1265685 RepID=A0ABV2GDP9_9BACL